MSSPELANPGAASDVGTCRAHLEALAEALHLSPALRAEIYQLNGSQRSILHARNLAANGLSEQIGCERVEGDGWWFTWSWGDTIGPASDPVGVAKVIGHMLRLKVPDVQLR